MCVCVCVVKTIVHGAMITVCLPNLSDGWRLEWTDAQHITVQSNRVGSCRTGLNDFWQFGGSIGHVCPGGSVLDKQGSAPIKLPSVDKLWSDTN